MAPPNDGSAEESTEQEGSAEEESTADAIAHIKKDFNDLKELLTAIQTPSEDVEEESSESESTDPKPKPKVTPHIHTVKYAESLKKQLGAAYVKEWDKISIAKRIDKMETILEFTANQKPNEEEKKKGVTEGKKPKGKADTPKPLRVPGGINYAALAEKLNKL